MSFDGVYFLRAVAAVFTLLSAWFGYIDSRATSRQHEEAFAAYNDVWMKLVTHPWKDIPFHLADLFVLFRRRLEHRLVDIRYGGIVDTIDALALMAFSLIAPFFVYAVDGVSAAFLATLLIAPYFCGVVLDHVFYHSLDTLLRSRFGNVLNTVNLIGLTWSAVDVLRWSSRRTLVEAAVTLGGLTILLWNVAARWFDHFMQRPQWRDVIDLRQPFGINASWQNPDGSFGGVLTPGQPPRVVPGLAAQPEAFVRQDILGAVIAGSFMITVSALGMGQIVAPQSEYSLSVHLFAVNAACDALTFIVASFLLKAALDRRIGLLEATGAALAIATVLAVMSLTLGTIGTPHSISPVEAWHIFVGRDRSGRFWQLGSYFWVMHTSFLPMLCYWGLLAVFVVQRCLLLTAALVVRRQPWERPHGTTARMCGLAAGVLAVCSFVVPLL